MGSTLFVWSLDDSPAFSSKSRCGVILSLYNEAQSRLLRWPITGKTRHAAILFLNIKAKSRLRQWPHAIRILHFADLSVFSPLSPVIARQDTARVSSRDRGPIEAATMASRHANGKVFALCTSSSSKFLQV